MFARDNTPLFPVGSINARQRSAILISMSALEEAAKTATIYGITTSATCARETVPCAKLASLTLAPAVEKIFHRLLTQERVLAIRRKFSTLTQSLIGASSLVGDKIVQIAVLSAPTPALAPPAETHFLNQGIVASARLQTDLGWSLQ